ncbi:NAD-dependent epimerase/dehydratase family protein [Nocardioides marmoribigeumensis]|uniref:Nucleoside-diphosphate-sugar epimerase n=1 Tax=Nocardioides marmoribigeumensis TaxID=433649 RepID=A0ABU2BZ97_9ACTN|nr:NAD-dependent epimerase/dehydratase family protein [Nocardioides marmoribigeumensis]MDR7363731.1 nucleoside-diphosphate-sugar epimerase [Nocardioides marmoribigeumensis]
MTEAPSPAPLTVAVTGPTGTFGFGLMPLLQDDERVGKVVGIARRPFDPGEHGWSKMVYRQGDVRDPDALAEAFAGADAVVHLAFLIVGGSKETTQAINVEGTVNAFRAAAEAGVKRFVYSSSIAAYGFHPDTPVGITEDWPTRPADRLFYAQEKAELERRLGEEAAQHPEIDVYLLRPPIVLGPHAVGAKVVLPAPLGALAKAMAGGWKRLPVRVPVVVADVPIQFIHESDVGRALLQCVVAAGPPGAYNIAADDVVSSVQIAREVGARPIPLPGRPLHAAARALSRVPGLPSVTGWVEALAQPMVMDTTKARTELGWTPEHSGLDALRDTLG